MASFEQMNDVSNEETNEETFSPYIDIIVFRILFKHYRQMFLWLIVKSTEERKTQRDLLVWNTVWNWMKNANFFCEKLNC